jgi:hypothetical protein
LACTQFPDLEHRTDAAALEAPFPDLIPLGGLLAAAPAPSALVLAAPSADRLARLRARAARLRGPVIDRMTRIRMTRGIPNPF